MITEPKATQQLLTQLRLSPHPEGGYYRRTLTSNTLCQTAQGERPSMSSIYYCLTQAQPIGHCHRNRSGILHCWQAGGPLRYTTLSQQGALQQWILGPDLASGQRLQLWVAGGYWKASELMGGDYALISEAVSPGFDYADQEMATADLCQQAPAFSATLSRLIARPD